MQVCRTWKETETTEVLGEEKVQKLGLMCDIKLLTSLATQFLLQGTDSKLRCKLFVNCV